MALYLTYKECQTLARIFRKQGVPLRVITPLLAYLHVREVTRGIEDVVALLKEYKRDLIAGDGKVPKTGKIIHQRWKGPFSFLKTKASRSRRDFTQVLRVLSIHGRWSAKEVTEKDYIDFRNSVKPNPSYETVSVIDAVTPEDNWLASQCQPEPSYYVPDGETRYPWYFDGEVKQASEIDLLDHVETLANCPNLVLRHYDTINKVVKIHDRSVFEEHAKYNNSQGYLDMVGVVSCLLKDRSLKKRFVAMPIFLLQQSMENLKSVCSKLLDSLPESAVRDQEKGREWVSDQLKRGKTCYCYDLHRSTDNIPLEPQIELIEELFLLRGYSRSDNQRDAQTNRLRPQRSKLPQDQRETILAELNLFKEVARQGFYARKFSNVIIHWTKGQPLGTGPSFSLFSLYHIFLIRSLGGDASCFRIVGDDVVITDEIVAGRYEQAMSSMKVIINDTKSVISSRLAEFAGRLIDSIGVLKVQKANKFEASPTSVIDQYGFAGLGLLPKRWASQVLFFYLKTKPESIPHWLVERISPEDSYKLWADCFEPDPIEIPSLSSHEVQHLFTDNEYSTNLYLHVSKANRADVDSLIESERTKPLTERLCGGVWLGKSLTEYNPADRQDIDHINAMNKMTISEDDTLLGMPSLVYKRFIKFSDVDDIFKIKRTYPSTNLIWDNKRLTARQADALNDRRIMKYILGQRPPSFSEVKRNERKINSSASVRRLFRRLGKRCSSLTSHLKRLFKDYY